MKNNKGITLIALVITMIIMLIIMSVMVYSSTTSLRIKALNSMYSDIRVLEEKIAIYYLGSGKLPTIGDAMTFAHSINPNDGSVYYEIRLGSLGGITLNYMREDQTYDDGKYKERSLRAEPDDVYIINEQSHTVYYIKGIKAYDETTYYTIPVNEEEVPVDRYYMK